MKMKEVIFPKKIKNKATIAVVTPAGAIEKGQLDTTLAFLKKQGFKIVLGEHVYAQKDKGYIYGGTEKQRLKDLQWALNGDFDVIWTTRGGYGCAHLLQQLDLKKFKKKPKFFIGYSDVTVLQSLLLKSGFGSVHGQSIKMPSSGVSRASYEMIIDVLKGEKPTYTLSANQRNKKGWVKGQLVGGNLAMIYSLMGTEYQFDFADKVLFIEDIGENFYALDRMLMNLELAGVFKKIKGLIVGGMTQMGNEKNNKNYLQPFDATAYDLIAERLEKYDFPMAFGMSNGHIFDNFPLLLGAEVQLEVKKKVKISFK